MKTLVVSGAIALLVVGASTASATTVKCQRTIAKASAQFLQAKAKALRKCHESIVKNGSGSCPDQKATDAVAKATTKLTTSIGKTCGGDDRVCGGDVTNEDAPASVGWPAACPNFERGPCDFAIDDCGGIASCLTCIGNAAVDQAVDLYYDDLLLPSWATSTRANGPSARRRPRFSPRRARHCRNAGTPS